MSSSRTSTLILLVLVPLAAWFWIVIMARDMYGPMTGASAWMMTTDWDVTHLLLLWAMWAVMMIAMMLPSASPMLLLFGVVAERSGEPMAGRRVYALAAGYLVVWAAFSLGATVLQRVLASLLLLSPMMEASNAMVTAVLLFIAGAYQLTPIKNACLHACRSPLGFLTTNWRSGMTGAFRMGVEHGALCVGCCWALMLLLFAGGVMNLTVIVLLTLFVAFEKLAPLGGRTATISGVGLIAAGVAVLTR